MLVIALALAACRGTAAPSGAPESMAVDPTDDRLYEVASGPFLAFGSQDGKIRNSFHRQGPVSAHFLTRSGEEPRIIVAFPANNQGIGIWFEADGPAELSDAGTGLSGVVRKDGDTDMIGVRAMVTSDARSLSAFLTLLGGVRTLRDFGYGVCLEDTERFPELRNETIELIREHRVVRLRREQIGGRARMELLLKARGDTSLSLQDQAAAPRPQCGQGSIGRKAIQITSARGIELELVALSNEKPLTPVDEGSLFLSRPKAIGPEANALAFLSYEEKLLAGSWRFLTYFGRDTLISLRLLMPVLKSDFVEMALGAVIERINLDDRAEDPAFGAIEVGDVAHEEEVGDYAAYRNERSNPRPIDLRAPRYDYKMIDDDFLLAPVLEALLEKRIRESGLRSGTLDAFFARTRQDGRSFRDAVLRNLALVLLRARSFADDSAPNADKRRKLVALKPNLSVGEWRDSEMGLAFGRYPFDVNAGLVPGALGAAASLYRGLGLAEEAREAERLLVRWQGVEELFRVDLPASAARANVARYASFAGVSDASRELEPESDGAYRYYGIALDEQGQPLQVLNSDHGFVMEFAKPSSAYLERAAETLSRPFPAGLMSSVGLLVANPGLGPAPLWALFARSHYHGTVVWSWQQALLAAGLRRQLERTDLTAAARAALQRCECELWKAIERTRGARAGELWSWEGDAQGRMALRAFGDVRSDVDESNAIQLWSTVYLAVERPTPEQNRTCAEPR